jgi:hypothetical protein
MLFYPQLLAGHSCYAADVPTCLPSGGWGEAFRRGLSLALLLGSSAEFLRLRAALDVPPARPLFVYRSGAWEKAAWRFSFEAHVRFTPIADIPGGDRNVRFVPKADIAVNVVKQKERPPRDGLSKIAINVLVRHRYFAPSAFFSTRADLARRGRWRKAAGRQEAVLRTRHH